jgi:hypothetical protein
MAKPGYSLGMGAKVFPTDCPSEAVATSIDSEPELAGVSLLWLVQGAVVTAELAALIAYGHRRIAQRRLARLVDYGIVTGFWAANRQRPRGRYAYALTKMARAQLERLVWPDGKPKIGKDGIETVSPVIHQLATHDLFGAFLRSTDLAREIGISAWAPERACVRLKWDGYLRPDALAVIRVGDASIVMFVERDLGTERGGTLSQKVFKYGNVYGNRESTGPLHVGLVVDTARRAASVRRHVGDPKTATTSVRVWVTTEPALAADPYGCEWGSASGEEVRTVDLAPHWTGDPWAILQPLCLAEPDNLEGLDERGIGFIPLLREAARY